MTIYAVSFAAVMLAALGACSQQSDTSPPRSDETVTVEGNAAAETPAVPVETRREGAPTGTERDRIAAVLRAAGYTEWREIERDDDGPHWEVDDARRPDGSKWDLKLNADTFAIVEVERDDE